jgi:hypothetical protein
MIVKNGSRRRAGIQEVRTRTERLGYRTTLVETQNEYTTKWVARLVVLALIIGGVVHAIH